MRIYQGFEEAFKETERELIEMGTINHPQTMQDKIVKDDDNFITKELVGYSYCINLQNAMHIEEDFKNLGGNMEYVENEFLERKMRLGSIQVKLIFLERKYGRSS
jgi:hypothetical protein